MNKKEWKILINLYQIGPLEQSAIIAASDLRSKIQKQLDFAKFGKKQKNIFVSNNIDDIINIVKISNLIINLHFVKSYNLFTKLFLKKQHMFPKEIRELFQFMYLNRK